MIIKLNKNLIAKFKVENFNSCIDEGEFPSELKHADMVPIHKEKDKSDKSNYGPVSILSNYSKVYEKLIYNHDFISILKIYCFQINVDFEKDTASSTVS